MPWDEPWSKAAPARLACYVTPEAAAVTHLIDDRFDTEQRPAGRDQLLHQLYDSLKSQRISYDTESYHPNDAVQLIGTPREILESPRAGTCLDLSVLFCGLCVAFKLLPVLVVTTKHAFAMVSRTRGLSDWFSIGRPELKEFEKGKGQLADGERLRRWVDDRQYFAIECTGFAHSTVIHPAGSDPQGRKDGFLSFDQATAEGRRQLDDAGQVQFALDIASLHYRWGLPPFLRVDMRRREVAIALVAEASELTLGLTRLPSVQLRDRLSDLLARHRLFGGRDQKLAELDAFVTDQSSGYLFVSGGLGMGKTALLANWVQRLVERDEYVAYHFISRADDVADEDFTLRSLCQQLATLHGLRGDLPVPTTDLRALYPRLLEVPALIRRQEMAKHGVGKRVIVILDGLDEVSEWTMKSDLFPGELPFGVYVVFSARDVVGRDWLSYLNLVPENVKSLQLENLGTSEIGALLRTAGGTAAGNADNMVFLEAVRVHSEGGTPFYLRYLVEDIRDKHIADLKALNQEPKGLTKLLDTWWKQVRQIVGERPVKNLFSYLVLAKGRLSQQELADIAKDDDLDEWSVGATLEKSNRWVIGNEQDGYRLCHQKFGDYIAQQVKTGLEEPRRNLLLYCKNWRQNGSKYALKHFVEHLLELNRFDEAVELLTPDWLAEKWDQLGHRSIVMDLERLARASAEGLDDLSRISRLPALVVARATWREKNEDPPSTLLPALVRLGKDSLVFNALGPRKKGEELTSAENLIAVAETLICHVIPTVAQEQRADVEERAVGLLIRAVDRLEVARAMRPLKPTRSVEEGFLKLSVGQLRLLRRITALADRQQLRESILLPLLTQAEEFAKGLEPDVSACALGGVARALAKCSGQQERAWQTLEEAEKRLAAANLTTRADRIFVTAHLLGAIRLLQPERLRSVVTDAVHGLENPPLYSSLGKGIVDTFLKEWAPTKEDGVDWIESILKDLAKLYLDRKTPEYLPGQIIVALCKLDRLALALEFLASEQQRYPIYCLYTLIETVESLQPDTPQALSEQLLHAVDFRTEAKAQGFRGPLLTDLEGRIAFALASAGYWSEAFQVLAAPNHRSLEGLADLAAKSTDSTIRRERIRRLVSLFKVTAAKAADALAVYDPNEARRYLKTALEHHFCYLPKASVDRLLEFEAMTLLHAGRASDTRQAVKQIRNVDTRVDAYSALIEAVANDSNESLEGLVKDLVDTVEGLDSDFGGYRLSRAMRVAQRLASRFPELSILVCDSIVAKCPPKQEVRWDPGLALAPVAVYLTAEPDRGREAFTVLLNEFRERLKGRERSTVPTLSSILGALERFAHTAPKEASELLLLLPRFDPLTFTTRQGVRLGAQYAVVLARAAPASAQAALEQVLERLTDLERSTSSAPGLPHLDRMTREQGGAALPRAARVDVAGAVAHAIIEVFQSNPKRCGRLALQAFDVLVDCDSAADRLEVIGRYINGCAGAPESVQPELEEIYRRVAENKGVRPQDLLDAGLHEKAVLAAAETLGLHGLASRAELFAAGIRDERIREETLASLRKRCEVDSSPQLRSFLLPRFRDGRIYDVLYASRSAEQAKLMLGDLVRLLLEDNSLINREYLIEDFSPLLVPLLSRLGGSQIVGSMIKAMESFDSILIEAAPMIAERAFVSPKPVTPSVCE